MKHLSRLAICGLITTAVYAPASAQTGYKPGNILMHLSLAGVLPEDLNSGTTLAGFNVKVSDSASPELDGSYFGRMRSLWRRLRRQHGILYLSTMARRR